MTANANASTPARRPLPEVQLDALLRGVLGSPTLSRAQRARHLRRLLPADAPARSGNWNAPAIQHGAQPRRPLPTVASLPAPARRGRLRQGASFVAAMLALALVAGLLAAVFGAGDDASRRQAAGQPVILNHDLIAAWDVEDDGRFKLFNLNVDGGQPSKLTPGPAKDDPARESAAAVAPDGKRVAYISDRDGVAALYVMDGNPRKVADGPLSFDAAPVWSPDGTRLLFTQAGPPGQVGNLTVVNADGSDRRTLTQLSAGAVWPSWSPDGARIAYVSVHDTGLAIWVMNADGSDARAVTNTPTPDLRYAWSPDGAQLAYTVSGGALYVVDADGQGSRLLRESGAWLPRWSPDGSQLAFIGGDFAANTLDLFVMRADGSQSRQLTQQAGGITQLAWSPDGRRLAYVSGPRVSATPDSGAWELRVVNADGTADRRVLSNVDPATAPVWRPTSTPDNTPAAPTATPTSSAAPNNVYVVTASGVTAIDAKTGDTRYKLPAPFSPDAALAPDGTRLYVADNGAGGTLSAHDAATGAELWRVPFAERVNWIDGLGPPTLIAAPDGKRLIVVHSNAADVQAFSVVDVADGHIIADSQPLIGYCPAIVNVSGDGKTLYAACLRGGSVRTIDLETLTGGRQLAVDGTIAGSAASADGSRLYVVSITSAGYQMTTIDMNQRAIVHQSEITNGGMPPQLLLQVALSPTGTRLFVGVRTQTPAADDFPYSDAVVTLDTTTWRKVGRVRSERRVSGQGLTAPDDGTVYGITRTADSRSDSLGNAITAFDMANGTTRVLTTQGSEIIRVLAPAVAASGTTGVSAPTGQLAFVSDRDGNDEIYLVNADGSALLRLTNDPAPDAQPVWSPDGGQLAFLRGTEGVHDLWVMDADGGNARDITNLPGDEIQPDWAPDGRSLVFAYRAPDIGSSFQIYAVGVDDVAPHNLSNQPATDQNFRDDQSPAWSPDGTSIAFSRQGPPSPQIWLMNADGANQRALTSNPDTAEPDVAAAPEWSPDGQRILYRLLTDQWRYNIINADGSGQVTLTPDNAFNGGAEWAVDGASVIGYSDDEQGVAIWMTVANSTSARPFVTFSADRSLSASDQSSDGNWLAVILAPDAGPPDTAAIQIVTADGRLGPSIAGSVSPVSNLAWRPTTVPQTPLATRQQLAYADANGLLVTDDSGSAATTVTAFGRPFNCPRWSPDGSQLAALTARRMTDTSSDLYVAAADGSDSRRIATSLTAYGVVTWSPDGQWLAFISDGGLTLVHPDGSDMHRLLPADAAVRGDAEPTWSPDGQQLAFSDSGTGSIFVVNVDGSALRQLTEGGTYDGQPVWSPDGARIAFATRRFRDGGDVAVIDADGSHLQNVTAALANGAMDPAWSPDGSLLAFAAWSDDGHDSAVWVANLDGSGARPVTQGDGRYAAPVWSPDGAELAAFRYPDRILTDTIQDGTVWVANADGSNQRQIAVGRCAVWRPAAQPDNAPSATPTPTPTPSPGSSNLTLDQAQALLPFVLALPDPLPEELTFASASADPIVMTYPQGANPGPTWRATLTYQLRLPRDASAPAAVQLEEANIRVGNAQGDRLQLGGKTVTRSRVTDADGQTIVTYAWDAAGLAFTLSATLGQGIDEALLERFVSAMPSAATPAWAGQLYAFRDGDVAVVDSQTGAVTRTLGAQIGSQSPFLAVDAASGRIAVADFLRDGDSVSFGVMIYRTSDGSLEREIPVPTLIRYLGPGEGIALSPGGQYLSVFQYETPPDGNGDNARYWLGVWDLNSGEHVRDIPVNGCPIVTRMVSPQPNHLYLRCTDYWQVFDPVEGNILDTYGPKANDAVFLVRDGQLYEVSPNWHAQVTPLDGSSGGREYTALAANLPDLVAAPLAIGLDPTGQYLYVPAGAPDAGGPTAIAVIDLRSGRPSRVIPLGQPFREVAFAPDASAAIVTLTDADGAATGLARIDLTLGRITWQRDGAFYEVTVVAP